MSTKLNVHKNTLETKDYYLVTYDLHDQEIHSEKLNIDSLPVLDTILAGVKQYNIAHQQADGNYQRVETK